MNFDLLKKLCSIHSPSGDEYALTEFLINYFKENTKNFDHKPELFYGKDFKEILKILLKIIYKNFFKRNFTIFFY